MERALFHNPGSLSKTAPGTPLPNLVGLWNANLGLRNNDQLVPR